ncbi:MAG: nucleotidyl transferase AbiEii/AbiGii toxin family protein [Thermoanaerobaculales bacterium]|nr:nucleotidyl transferase AbiEii/AbiGii toxin family protein [Thermoanaerobaculales bacterium]
MHEKVLPRGSREVLARLEPLRRPELEGWVLAGGTGLALQLGHRVSEDFDLFRTTPFSADRLARGLGEIGDLEVLQDEEHTLTVILSGVKISFFSAPESFLFPTAPYSFFEIADPRDIALMKLAAVSGRGSRKDFVDLYTILRGGLSLEQCLDWLPKRYGEGRVNAYHVLKSLTYFEDAEREPMPRMLEPFDWSECTRFFVREAHAIVLP